MKIPGTNTTAIQNTDGTWDLFDVPIVHDGSIPRFNRHGEKVDEFATDPEWFSKVLATHHRALSEGIMGRAFIDHHDDDGGSRPDAGWIRPRRIGKIRVGGKVKAALFSDIVSMPDDVYQTWIKTGRLCYRSIESRVAETGWIDGLALMATRPPHYRLPMLTIGREVVPDGTSLRGSEGVAAVACETTEQAYAIWANLRETDMADETKKDDAAPESTSNDSESKGSNSGWKSMLERLKSVKVEAEDIPEFVAALREFADSMDQGSEEEAEIEEPESPTPEPPGEEGPVAEQDLEETFASKVSNRVIQAEAKALAADARSAKIEREIKIRDAVDKAADDLSDFNIGSDPKAVLRAKAEEYGLKGLALFVETIKANAPRSPGLGDNSQDVSVEDMDDLPAEVMAFTDPGDREIAVKAYRRLTEQAHMGFDVSHRNLKGMIHRDIRRARAKRAKK